ncbi:MAG: tRNA uridine-5-carboxymethylaminomethyl(34) synthesis GTPase MnmE [Oscillospiraceae bacterium]|nr:tRNA uridine-5-carboxymethylaminomethyl(34) synthesis GTPase MnmE [Oscillospiraceae bacterium]
MDTIAAIATPQGTGGMAVIRISGAEAITRAAEIFTPVRGRAVTDMDGYTCAYGYVMRGGERLDDAVLTVFRAPHSYTGEDVAELSCHGGRYLTEQVLRTVLCDRVRLAEPGEFTRRAYLNGKMNLMQAEAVADLIAASGENAMRAARSLRDGASFRRIRNFSETLLVLLSDLAVWADYPDEDIPDVDGGALASRLTALLGEMRALIATYDYGRILREGLHTVIAGKPNVGKSTLFNALAGFERSIVTDIAGTTRDVVEEQIRIGGYTLRLSDTAGVRETAGQIERIGVERSLAYLGEADLVLAVFDMSRPCDAEDAALLEKLPRERTICVCNKGDLARKWDGELDGFAETVEISAKTAENMDALEKAVSAFAARRAVPAEDGLIANERQRTCLTAAADAVQEGLNALQMGLAYDAVTVSLDDAAAALLELTGERVTDRVVDTVFSRFCVGK